jgi:uncharacterized protein YbjT (DUF2867 family)
MTSSILVTGGTGLLGRQVVPLLQAAGATDLRVASRGRRESIDGLQHVVTDLRRDQGVDAAVEGREIVLHLAGGPKGDDQATRNLVRASAAAGVRHLVLISVIGADSVPIGYFKAKHGAEQAVTEGAVPWTILRAAQFHDLIYTMVEKMMKLPALPIPRAIRMQPVDTGEVAQRLSDLTLAAPSGRVADLAGPAIRPLGELARIVLDARGKRRPQLPVPLPGKVGRAYKSGANLSLEGTTGTKTWEAFVAERTARDR